MEEIIAVKDLEGKTFYVGGDKEGKFISVLAPGYIILKDGSFVTVGSNHGQGLTDFYVNYHGVKERKRLTTQDAIIALAQDGLVVYLGTCRNYVNSVTDLGFAILYLVDELTDEQKDACQKLLNTNRKVLNPNEKRLKIEYGNGINLGPLTEYEVRNTLMKRNKVKIKK